MSERKLIFRDHHSIGRLLGAILGSCALVWIFVWFQVDFDFLVATLAALCCFLVLFLFMPLRGRLYSTRNVEWLEMSARGLEGRTQQTIGRGRQIRFKPSEVTWRGSNDPEPKLFVKIGRREYSLDIKNAQSVDRDALLMLAPDAIAAAEAPKPEKPDERVPPWKRKRQ